MGKLDPLRHHREHQDKHGAFGNDKFGAGAEKFATFLGTPKYLVGQTLFVIAWIIFNIVAIGLHHWDPYPFILLNLAFSTQAAYAAPLILLAQTRAADRDKAAEKASALHRQEIADAQEEQLRQDLELTTQIHGMQAKQMEILAILKEHFDGGPGDDQAGDSEPDSGEHGAGAEHVSGVPGHGEPADAPGDT